MKAIEYFPWSEDVLNECISDLKSGKIPCLDIELSASCDLIKLTSGCIYCDSYNQLNMNHENELKLDELAQIFEEGKNLGVKWVYICGLGEPLNDPNFFDVISILRKSKINVSLFSNGLYINDESIDFLYRNSVNLIIKCDTFSNNTFNKILGGKNAQKYKLAEKVYTTITRLIDYGYSESPRSPNLALSIVPTKFNISDISSVVDFSIENNLFPLIGELECAGKAKRLFSEICPTNRQLCELYELLKNALGKEYNIPICPAAVAGMHVNNVGNVIVHKGTGINCGWFALGDPEMIPIGNIRTSSLSTLFKKIQDYRRKLYKASNLRHWVEQYSHTENNLVFGGCGGKELSKYFLGIMANIYETKGDEN